MTIRPKESTTDRSRALVRSLWEAVNERDINAIKRLCPPDYRHHDPSLPKTEYYSLDSYLEDIWDIMNAFPDIRLDIQDVIAEGDAVACRWTFSGTHLGELMGMAPTSKHVSVEALSIHRTVGDKVVEGWVIFDAMGVLQQFGAAHTN